ncbi:mCG148458 [Mus musculus]|nr:mCG148458 [Mus musculus]
MTYLSLIPETPCGRESAPQSRASGLCACAVAFSSMYSQAHQRERDK